MIFELVLLAITVSLALWIGVSYLVVRNIEKPTYTVFRSHRSYEIRQYDPYIIAYVDVSGDFNQSQNNGFSMLANYIFGGNIKKKKKEMTAPVIQKPLKEDSIKIKMTAPVIQDKIGDTYRISFVMPSKFIKN